MQPVYFTATAEWTDSFKTDDSYILEEVWMLIYKQNDNYRKLSRTL